MSDVSNADLMKVLLDVRGDIGALQADVRNTASTLQSHIEEDRGLTTRVGNLESYRANQTGKASVWGLIWAGLGSISGSLITLWAKH
jgi:hypothetical protein